MYVAQSFLLVFFFVFFFRKSVSLTFRRSVKVQHLGKVMLDERMCPELRKTMVFGKCDLV